MHKLIEYLCLVGVLIFAMGLHNIDNAYNLQNLNCDIDETQSHYIDQSILGTKIEANQLYNLGLTLVFAGFLIVSALLIFLFKE